MATEMFRPPVNRAMRVLDRSFFQKRIPISAARIEASKDISQCRNILQSSKDVLSIERYQTVQPDPADNGASGKRCILLRPQLDAQGTRLLMLEL